MSHACHFVHRALLAAAGSFLLSCNKTLIIIKIIRDGLKGNKKDSFMMLEFADVFSIYIYIFKYQAWKSIFDHISKHPQRAAKMTLMECF